MIAIARELIQFLSSDLTVDDVVARVGSIVEDPGFGNMPLSLCPVVPGVRSARLTRNPRTGVPYLLTLDLEPSMLTVADLKDAFGDYHRGRTHPGDPVQLIFYPPAASVPWRVVLLVTTDRELDAASVTKLAFRRDNADVE